MVVFDGYRILLNRYSQIVHRTFAVITWLTDFVSDIFSFNVKSSNWEIYLVQTIGLQKKKQTLLFNAPLTDLIGFFRFIRDSFQLSVDCIDAVSISTTHGNAFKIYPFILGNIL